MRNLKIIENFAKKFILTGQALVVNHATKLCQSFSTSPAVLVFTIFVYILRIQTNFHGLHLRKTKKVMRKIDSAENLKWILTI